jgi:hypothetical protein
VKPTVEQISNLLALKRAEHPDSEYWQDFICEFHQNQREQSVSKSGLANVIGVMTGWLTDLGPSKWAYGAGVAYAAVTVAFLLTPRGVVTESVPASHVNFQVVPATNSPQVEQLKQLDLNPLTQGNGGEQVF